jgi:hypothetical protein
MADNDDLGKYQNMLPSRAVLARLSLFGTDEETRKSANAILKALPPMNEKERREYLDETWRLASLPSEAEMELSPVGRATLEMLKNSNPMSGEIQAKPEGAATPVVPGPAAPPVEPAIPPREPPPGPSDDLGVRIEQERAAKRESEQLAGPVHKWVKAEPTKGTGDRMPVSDWNSDASNQPLY